MRIISVMSVLLALHAGCSNQNKKAEPRADKDVPQLVSTDGPSAAQATDEQIHKLFYDAVYCAGPCPQRDQLRELKRTSPAQVAGVALAIMADPKSKTDQGVGLEAMLLVEDWLKAGPDEAVRKRTSQALARVAATGSTFMRTQAYELLAQFGLPDARQILIAEVENPARDVRERDHAARSLGLVTDDFELIRRWLRDDQPLHWEAALAMRKTFERDDDDARERRWDECRALFIALGKRPELPAAVVYTLAFWFKVYLDDNPHDAEILALAKRWAKHPDDMAAGQMNKILP